jgi:uncharacterized protein YndB with AHSA1/START domain
MKPSGLFALLVASTGLLGEAQANVVAAAAEGFTIVIETDVAVPPDVAYQKFVNGPALWWEDQHTYSGKAAHMTLDPRAGGCFCEQIDGGGSVSHGTVLYADPGNALRLATALGPLQEMAVVGTLSVAFAPRPEGTHLTLTYRVYGGFTSDAVELSKLVDAVIATQVQRYVAYVGRTG